METRYLGIFRLVLAFLLGLGFALMIAVADYLVVGNLSIVAYLVLMGPGASGLIIPLLLKMGEGRLASRTRLLLMSGFLFAVLSLVVLNVGLSEVVNQGLVFSQTITVALAGTVFLLAAITVETLAALRSSTN